MSSLHVPFKASHPSLIVKAIEDYILYTCNLNPRAFDTDITRWAEIRKATVGDKLPVAVDQYLGYYQHLHQMLTKFPSDINWAFTYAQAFSDATLTVNSLYFETSAVLFNLAAKYSKVASEQDLCSNDGRERAIDNYQRAAGTLSFLQSSNCLLFLNEEVKTSPIDFSEPFLKTLEYLMLAQAQECFVIEHLVEDLANRELAAIAGQTLILYRASEANLTATLIVDEGAFPPSWVNHVRGKIVYFKCFSQYIQSLQDIDDNRYCISLARLMQANAEVKAYYEGEPVPAAEFQRLAEHIKDTIDLAKCYVSEKAASGLALLSYPFLPAELAYEGFPSQVRSITPEHGGHDGSVISFEELPSRNLQQAIEVHITCVEKIITETLGRNGRDLTELAQRRLQSFGSYQKILESLDIFRSMDQTGTIHVSLLSKADEVTQHGGISGIDSAFDYLDVVEKHVCDVLDTVRTQLSMQSGYPGDRPTLCMSNTIRCALEAERKLRSNYENLVIKGKILKERWVLNKHNIQALSNCSTHLDLSDKSAFTTRLLGHSLEGSALQREAGFIRYLLAVLKYLWECRCEVYDTAHGIWSEDDVKLTMRLKFGGLNIEETVLVAAFKQEIAKYTAFVDEIENGRLKEESVLSCIQAHVTSLLTSANQNIGFNDRETALVAFNTVYDEFQYIVSQLTVQQQALIALVADAERMSPSS
ncbi:BRO1-like domain-containing protein [Hygrophoropsis aurantiaca]|uniref:BRO1-like domain-containing protein n=1 Tax=Hygrophoropsis aurantiaca TaxID=72124 RepID=A0ACB7ZZ90_9AGAM|nr:BRO1-like domain-containing protein [Hygrophoropsis aurantiaca]